MSVYFCISALKCNPLTFLADEWIKVLLIFYGEYTKMNSFCVISQHRLTICIEKQMGYVDAEVAFSLFSNINNQLAVLLTQCRTTNQMHQMGTSKTIENNSDINTPYSTAHDTEVNNKIKLCQQIFERLYLSSVHLTHCIQPFISYLDSKHQAFTSEFLAWNTSLMPMLYTCILK